MGARQRVLVAAVVVAVVVVGLLAMVGSNPEGDEVALGELVRLAEAGRVDHATVFEGEGYLTGEYVGDDGTPAAFHTRYDEAIGQVLPVLMEHGVAVTVQRKSPLRGVAFAVVGLWVVAAGVAGYLVVSWRQGRPPFSSTAQGTGVRPAGGESDGDVPPAAGTPGTAAALAVRAQPRKPAPGATPALACAVAAFVVPIPLALPVVAIALAVQSRRTATAQPDRYTDELATVGLVLGLVAVALHAVVGLVLTTGMLMITVGS